MKRNDIKMTPKLIDFLSFDLGHMNEENFKDKMKDIPYYQDLKLDIYYPATKKDTYPVFLIVYGGGWVSGFKTDKFVEPMLQPLDHGYVCIVADYTLALDETFPRSIIDIKMALHWIHEHANEYHLDDSNITLWGESAGAHLALEAALMPNEYLNLKVNTNVKNLVIFYPFVNAFTIDNYESSMGKSIDENSVFGIYLGKGIHDKKILQLASPIHFLHEHMPSLWLQHGLADQILPFQQSLEIIEKMKQYPNIKFHYELCENKGHTDPYFFTKENVNRIISFIENE
ncbi:MAG: alpha/beta hydrolase fold domain-containing protein [Traorella sp.]